MSTVKVIAQSRPVILGAGVSIGALLVGGGIAVAATPTTPSSRVVHACSERDNGQLRVVAKNAGCRGSEVAISWDQAGPRGSSGPRGVPGVPGRGGPAGPTGRQGPSGPVGPQGTRGLTGLNGPAGPQGVAGPPGPRGPVGPQGPQGVAGQTGGQGPTGQQGVEGLQGPPGLTGGNGGSGPQGPTGPAGPAGSAGPEGPAGPAGPAGQQGPSGPKGDTGATGPQGPPGVSLGFFAVSTPLRQEAAGADDSITATCPDLPSETTMAISAGYYLPPGSSVSRMYLSGKDATVTFHIGVAGPAQALVYCVNANS